MMNHSNGIHAHLSLPTHIHLSKRDLNYLGLIGLILSMFQIAYLIVYLFLETRINKFHPKSTIVLGYLLISLATFEFAILYISNKLCYYLQPLSLDLYKDTRTIW